MLEPLDVWNVTATKTSRKYHQGVIDKQIKRPIIAIYNTSNKPHNQEGGRHAL
jgi:hypothetical protein